MLEALEFIRILGPADPTSLNGGVHGRWAGLAAKRHAISELSRLSFRALANTNSGVEQVAYGLRVHVGKVEVLVISTHWGLAADSVVSIDRGEEDVSVSFNEPIDGQANHGSEGSKEDKAAQSISALSQVTGNKAVNNAGVS